MRSLFALGPPISASPSPPSPPLPLTSDVVPIPFHPPTPPGRRRPSSSPPSQCFNDPGERIPRLIVWLPCLQNPCLLRCLCALASILSRPFAVAAQLLTSMPRDRVTLYVRYFLRGTAELEKMERSFTTLYSSSSPRK